MNRKSLFGRLSASTIVSRPAERPAYFRLQLEPLEERQLLSVDHTYVNDNWNDLTFHATSLAQVQIGDLVENSNGGEDGSLQIIYGTRAFGRVTTGQNGAISGANQTAAGAGLIHDAIQGTDILNGQVELLGGTHVESDIVIDRPLLFFGQGSTSLIVPEAVSSQTATENFGTGTHQGIIIYSPDVTVSNLRVDGAGNSGTLGAGYHFHHGITTLYDFQNAGNYSTLHNGTIAPIQLGAQFSANRSRPNIAVLGVTVDNSFWRGIVLSALGGQQWGTSQGSGQNVGGSGPNEGVLVRHVGTATNQDVNRIGILIQNVDNDPFGGPYDGNVLFSTVEDAGVGIATGVFGTKSYANQNNARNLTGLIVNTVKDAVVRGYSIEFGDGGEGKRGNIATWTSTTNTATGVYLNHSEAILTGFVISGAKIGIHIQNTPLVGDNQVILAIGGNVLTGPGTGVSGSVGVLIDNSASEPDSSNALLAVGLTINNYNIGVKAEQVVADTLTGPSPFSGNTVDVITLTMGEPSFGTNGSGIVLGNGVVVRGNDPSPSLTTTGNVLLQPGFPNWNNYYYLVQGNFQNNTPQENSPAFLAKPTADILKTGSLLLNSSTTYAPLLTNQSGTTALFNFNSALNFPFSIVPNAPVDGIVPSPNGVLFNWYGNLVQDGSGQIVLGGTATNGKGLDFAFAGINNPVVNSSPQSYQLQGVDISNRTTLNIVAKTTSSNQSETLGIGLFDVRGNANLWTFKFSQLNTSTYTTLQINLLAPSINLTGPDDHIDYTHISGWVFGGDQGAVNTNQNVPYQLIVDDMFASSIPNSQLNVAGTVNLGSATLALSSSDTFVPNAGQQFVIVENDSTDAVTGSFASLPGGSTMVIGGHTFSLVYNGNGATGNSNDVVLTEESPILDLNGNVLGSTYGQDPPAPPPAPAPLFFVKGGGAVNITAPLAATLSDGTNDGDNIVSLTATFAATPNGGDVLDADISTVPSMTKSYDSGTRTLSLTGTFTTAQYQTVMRTIKYNNTSGSGGPGVSPLTVTFVANDGTLNSAPAFAIISDPPPVITLTGGGSTNFEGTWSRAGGPVNIEDAIVDPLAASITDPDDTLLASMTVVVKATGTLFPPTGDPNHNAPVLGTSTLTADVTGTSISASYNTGTNTLTLTGTSSGRDTIANFQQVLRTVKYDNSGDPAVDRLTITFTASDGVATSVAAGSLALIDVALPLKVKLSGSGLNYTSSWVNAGAINIADPGSSIVQDTVITGANGLVDSMTLDIVSAVLTGDTLTCTVTGSITSSYDTPTGRLFLTGEDTPANYQTVLRSVKYDGLPATANRSIITINVDAVDGVSTNRTAQALIICLPVIDLDGGAPGTARTYATTWTPGSAVSVTNSTSAIVFDGGRPNLDGITVRITDGGGGADLIAPIDQGTGLFHTGDVLTFSTAGTNIVGNYNAGALSLLGNDTQANYQTVIRSIKYNNTSGGPGANAQVFIEFQALDGGDYSPGNPIKSLISVSTININAPLVLDLNGGTQGSNTAFIASQHWLGQNNPVGGVAPVNTSTAFIYFTSGATTLNQMTASLAPFHTGDLLSATPPDGDITVSYNAVTGVLTMSGTDLLADYQTTLRSIRYDNNSAFGGPGTQFVNINLVGRSSGGLNSNASSGQIPVDPIEDLDLNGAGGGSDYVATWIDAGPVNITTITATVKDGQSATMDSMTVAVGNPHAGDSLAAITTGTDITVAGVGSSQLEFTTLAGGDTLIHWQTVLRTVQYFNTLGGPGVPEVFIQFNYADSISPVGTTREATVEVDVAPKVDLNGVTAGLDYTSSWSGTASNITDSGAAFATDGQSANLVSMTATISGVHTGDVLDATVAGGIAKSYNVGLHRLELTGTSAMVNYQNALRSIKYNNTSGGGPGVSTVTVDIFGDDGQPPTNVSATAHATISNIAVFSSSIMGRRLFYNQSGTAGSTVRYDGNNLAINSLDDNAIATDKVAYLPSAPGAATFANMSSYSKGINGIMVDISGTHPSIGPSDFEFHVGNNNTPSGWSLANPPTSVSVRAGAGTSGSDRVEIIWNSGAPLKQWLEVAVLATVNTGLTALGGGYTGARASWGDVFYFGNPVGNTGVGDTAVNSTVNSIDEGGARNNPQVVGNNIPITNIYDVNRNAVVNAIDEGTIRNNNTNSTTVLKYLNLADPPLAPQGGGGGGDAGVASALTATATPSTTPSMPRWLGLRLDEIDLNSGRVADVFQRLHDVNNAGTRKLLLRADAIADALNLDHELLDSLLADLGLE